MSIRRTGTEMVKFDFILTSCIRPRIRGGQEWPSLLLASLLYTYLVTITQRE